MLAQEDVARYLLERDLLAPDAVLDGQLAIRDASSRNRNYRVETRDGPCYLLKQGVTDESIATVQNEAAVYQRLLSLQDGMSANIPRFFGYDPSHGLLALELIRDAEDLRTLHLRTGTFSAGPAARLGSALGLLHASTHFGERGSAGGAVGPPGVAATGAPAAASAPWVLWVHRPNASVFRDASAASLELIRIIQGAAGFPEAFDRLRGTCAQSALIHGDVKWDNCLVSYGAGGAEELKLIDWESAALGDPGWDAGSALSHYLSFWLFSIPVTGSIPPRRFPELAQYQLDAMKPALSAFWVAYVAARGLAPSSSGAELIRVVQFAAARLVQTAFEATQMMQQLTSAIVLHLQLALNVLQRPDEAASSLMGLPLIRSVRR